MFSLYWLSTEQSLWPTFYLSLVSNRCGCGLIEVTARGFVTSFITYRFLEEAEEQLKKSYHMKSYAEGLIAER